MSVLIINGCAVLRCGLRHILKEEFRDIAVEESGTLHEALRKTPTHLWTLAILCLGNTEDNLYAMYKIRELRPDVRFLLLGGGTPGNIARALKLGASGYLPLEASRIELIRAVRSIRAGRIHVSGCIREQVEATLRQLTANPHPKLLSLRERQVKEGLAAGMHEGEIAAELNLSAKTVSTYKRRLLDKLGLRSTADLVRMTVSDYQVLQTGPDRCRKLLTTQIQN